MEDALGVFEVEVLFFFEGSGLRVAIDCFRDGEGGLKQCANDWVGLLVCEDLPAREGWDVFAKPRSVGIGLGFSTDCADGNGAAILEEVSVGLTTDCTIGAKQEVVWADEAVVVQGVDDGGT